MYFLIENYQEPIANTPMVSLALVGVVGFIAATIIGSIAWYNSKRPLGWEDKERPDYVPEVKTEE